MASPFASVPRGKGMRAAERLIDHRADVVVVKEPLQGTGSGYALDSAGVEVRLMGADEHSDAIESAAFVT